jgi:hypothetical protein
MQLLLNLISTPQVLHPNKKMDTIRVGIGRFNPHPHRGCHRSPNNSLNMHNSRPHSTSNSLYNLLNTHNRSRDSRNSRDRRRGSHGSRGRRRDSRNSRDRRRDSHDSRVEMVRYSAHRLSIPKLSIPNSAYSLPTPDRYHRSGNGDSKVLPIDPSASDP